MAEYIDRKKLVERLNQAEENYKADHEYDLEDSFSDGILSAMFSVNGIVNTESTADVVERSKIDKAIEEIKAKSYSENTYGERFDYSNRIVELAEVVSILRNIGE